MDFTALTLAVQAAVDKLNAATATLAEAAADKAIIADLTAKVDAANTAVIEDQAKIDDLTAQLNTVNA